MTKTTKIKYIKINGITDVMNFVKEATKVEGDISARKGKFIVDCKSIMGIMSIDVSTGVQIEYPAEAVNFEEYLTQFEVK